MKEGFIGLRVEEETKKTAERIASLENCTLSQYIELLLKRENTKFLKAYPALRKKIA